MSAMPSVENADAAGGCPLVAGCAAAPSRAPESRAGQLRLLGHGPFRAQVHARPGEFRGAGARSGRDSRAERQRKIHAAAAACGNGQAALRPREVNGEGSERARSARTRAQRIALVQQESELLFALRVWEYVLQGRYPHGKRLRFESDEDCLLAETRSRRWARTRCATAGWTSFPAVKSSA
jgi:hypothetical protein